MKIGILTFHYAINYGAVLQAYSLQKVLLDLGVDVEIIDYVPDDFKVKSLKGIIANSGIKETISVNVLKRIMLNMLHQDRLLKGFEEFTKKYFNLSKHCSEKNWVPQFNSYDAIIVGSDQVWNPFNQKEDIYFINNELIMARRISYAADSTKSDYVKERYKELSKALRKFHSISVRNTHTEQFVLSLTGRRPFIVPDPVVLSNFEDLNVKVVDEEYVLIYVLGKEIAGGHEAFLNCIRTRYPQYKIIQISMLKQNKFAIIDGVDDTVYDCTPEQWLSYIKNAKIVYTDSYHCILFSLKYHINVIAYYSEKNRAPRLQALQKQYGIEKKIVSSIDELLDGIDAKIDFAFADSVFENERNAALHFLRSSLIYEDGNK